MRRRLHAVLLAAAVAAVSPVLAPRAAAQTATAQHQVVAAVPSRATPRLDGGTVLALARVGSWIVAGGSFTSAVPPGASTATPVSRVVAFDQNTGALDRAFRPKLNGDVQALAPGPTANTVYVGGKFTTVKGVKCTYLTLINLTTGATVSGFKTPTINGTVYGIRTRHGQLMLAGAFTSVAGQPRDGLASLNPNTGALTAYLKVALTGHHNYNGSGASGPVGARAIAIGPGGGRAVVVGNFKRANGALHDQIVMLSLTPSRARVDSRWNTAGYTATCKRDAFDSYVRDVGFAPNGSYFVVAATGARTFAKNSDGSRSLCDSAARWASTDTGGDVRPTWVDYTGNDSFWSVAVTGTAIYVGGHQRWLNNPDATDHAGPGAVPRPGIVALEPASGLPLTWNPGRNPRGAGAFALLATAQGLYVGSDTNYFGNFAYRRDEIGFFPLAGGYTPASTATAIRPTNVYEAGPLIDGSYADALAYRSWSAGTSTQTLTSLPDDGIAWASTRGVFAVGATLFYGDTSGNLFRASFDGSTVGTPTAVDPYDDAYWDDVRTGSGQTYRGAKPGYYGELPNVTGAFYSDGRLYYTRSGNNALHYRYFSPDSGIVGGTEFTVSGGSFANAAGMFRSGNKLYVAHRSDGTLHALDFTDGGTNGQRPRVSGPDTVVSGPGIDHTDWRATSLFGY